MYVGEEKVMMNTHEKERPGEHTLKNVRGEHDSDGTDYEYGFY